jgi:hypothetical protein
VIPLAIRDYDLELLTKDIQSLFRIEDWDTEVIPCTVQEMEEMGEDPEYAGLCIKDRPSKFAKILINLEHKCMATDDDWFDVYIHEVAHILTDDFEIAMENLVDLVPKNVKETLEAQNELHYERHNQMVTRALVNALGVDYYKKYKIEGGKNEEG